MSMASEVKMNHGVSFLLGAAVPTILLFSLASDRVGDKLSTISSWSNGIQLPANLSGTAYSAQDNETRFPGLEELLAKVAMEDKTVILTSVNDAWARPNSLFDLFRESFRSGEETEHLLNHTLVVAVDDGGWSRCAAVHPHCYLLLEAKAMNLSSANRFMTKGYLELVWMKLSLQQRVLELGYNFLFTDVDIVWFRNPFRHINLYADMTVATDHFYGEPYALTNSPNTGFYYMRSANRTVEMLKAWHAARSRFPADHDQLIFDKIKKELAGELHVRIEFLDTALFGGFCQYYSEMEKVCTMHANCCVGLENKVHDLRNTLADWKNYTRLPSSEKKSGKFKWTFPSRCKS